MNKAKELWGKCRDYIKQSFSRFAFLVGCILLLSVFIVGMTALIGSNYRQLEITTENTTTPVNYADKARITINEIEIAYLKDSLGITDANVFELVKWITAYKPPVYNAPDLTGFVRKGELSALEAKMALLINEIDDNKTAFNRANLYAGSLMIMQDDLAAVKVLIALSENVTAVHIADNTTHK